MGKTIGILKKARTIALLDLPVHHAKTKGKDLEQPNKSEQKYVYAAT
jgi:hypothetical protein